MPLQLCRQTTSCHCNAFESSFCKLLCKLGCRSRICVSCKPLLGISRPIRPARSDSATASAFNRRRQQQRTYFYSRHWLRDAAARWGRPTGGGGCARPAPCPLSALATPTPIHTHARPVTDLECVSVFDWRSQRPLAG